MPTFGIEVHIQISHIFMLVAFATDQDTCAVSSSESDSSIVKEKYGGNITTSSG